MAPAAAARTMGQFPTTARLAPAPTVDTTTGASYGGYHYGGYNAGVQSAGYVRRW